jgi:uncharacterized repeat protein (TIGR01451 family)
VRYPQQLNRPILIFGFILAAVVGGAHWARLTALPHNPATQPATPDVPLVIRIYYDDLKDLSRLQAYDVWEYNNLDEGYVLAAVDSAGYESLIRQGWTVTVEPDAAELYLRSASGGEAFYGGYRTVDELYAVLADHNANVPDLTELVVYGQSHCLTKSGCITPGGDVLPGYPLQALRITNEEVPGSSIISGQSIIQGTKPVFFLMANIHSREITTPELAMRLIEYLLDGYGLDADATWLIDYHEIWVVPMVNPDGHWLVELGQSETYGGVPFYQRKNANNDANTDNQPDCPVWPPASFEQYGIDLNRNHSFGWGPEGASDQPCEMTYRGPAAASEVEVIALEALVRSLVPDQRGPADTDAAPADTTGLLITLHSFSNLVLWPWGNRNAPAPNMKDLKAIGDKFSTYNNYQSCQPTQCLYLTTGSSDDWAYGELGIPAFTFEVGNQFMPPYTEIDERQWPDNRPAFLYAAKIARSPYTTVHGPDVLDPVVTGDLPVMTIAATVADWANGGNSITAAAYSVDVPPWQAGAKLFPLTAVDGSFDSEVEAVNGAANLSGLMPGRHILFVQGQDSLGNRGAVSAAFFNIETPWSFEKVASDSFVTPGGMISYVLSLHLERAGGEHAYTISVTDALPAGIAAIPDTIKVNGYARLDIYDPATGTIVYEDQGSFGDTLNLSITFVARVSDTVSPGTLIINEASAEATVDDEVLPIMLSTSAVPVIESAAYYFLPFAVSP